MKQICSDHWEPFKSNPPAGILCITHLLQIAVCSPEFTNVCPNIQDPKANDTLITLYPLCCRYSDYMAFFHKIVAQEKRLPRNSELQQFITKKFSIDKLEHLHQEAETLCHRLDHIHKEISNELEKQRIKK